ncbi:hypothetical protein QBC45DRAFT_423774 [Copromyces sp. CBS 386.78]|nr:hypothetical protein QBC45DRAFT_423774 [Copromyces sp. CBS 386.78]
MADPLSIAGLITGVVSLGIQLHNDLHTFLDIVKHRDEDIAKLARQAATMAQALDAIDRSLQNSNQANQGAVDSATIIPLLDASRQELLLLHQEVASLTKTSKGQKISGVVEFAKATTQKLKYPRQRANIQKLEEGLDQANKTLQLALNAFGLSELSSIKSNTEVVVHGLSNIHKTLPDVEARVSELSGSLMATNKTATQSIQKIEGVINLAISSHEAGLKQLGQAQSNEFSEIKQLIQDLSRKMDANASTGSKETEVYRNTACLISKPSALKSLCDEYSNYQPTSWCPSDTKDWPACTFQCRRIVTRQSFDWGPFRLSTESKADFVHHESCQWAQLDTPKQSKTIRFVYRGFNHLLRHAVAVTFRLKHGAGGFSLGSAIDHYPVIDENAYAPFKLVRYVYLAMEVLTDDAHGWIWPGRTRIPQEKKITLTHKVLEAFSMHISRACFNGTIVPRAVNIHGETLLHRLSQLIQNLNHICGCCLNPIGWTPSMFASVHEVFAKLLMCNVPMTVYDDCGRLAHLTIANCIPTTNENMLASMTSVLRLFTSRDIDIDTPKPRKRSDTFQLQCEFLKPLPEISVFSKAFGCNELGTATLQQNISAVRSLLFRAPALISEQDLNGLTPLHYAVTWKDGLSMILEQVPVENFAEDLTWDVFRYAVSMYLSNHRDLCSEICHCSECIMIFLDHSWYFAPCSSQGRAHGTLRLILENLSLAAQSNLLLYLKQSRQEIVGPILQKLFGDGLGRQLDAMNLPTDVVHIIIDHLQKTAAALCPGARRARTQAAVDSFHIYCEIKDEETAEVAWQLGFHEVDYHGATDSPPLAYIPYDALTDLRFHSEEYVLWLLDHGADPLQPLHDTGKRNAPTRAVHKAIHCIRHSFDWEWCDDTGEWEPNGLKQDAQEVARRLCGEQTTDGCVCACSADGCTPFLILLRNLVPVAAPEHKVSRPKDYAFELRHISTMLWQDHGFPCHYEGQFREALRLFTSMALGIRHTCCKKHGYHNDGDAEEIREEDSELVDILEDLMEQWHDLSFKSAQDFWCFLDSDWVIRLDTVFNDLRQIDQSEEHRSRLQSLGVQLKAPAVKAKGRKPRTRKRSLIWCEESFWLDLLDTIVEGGDTRYFDRVLEDAYRARVDGLAIGRDQWEEEDEQWDGE